MAERKNTMNAFTLNHNSKTIIITKKYAHQSSVPNSSEFAELKELKSVYRDYSVIVRTTSRKKSKTSKITLANMRAYISKHDASGTIMTEFETVVKESDESIEYNGFFGIKKWFLEQYPELNA
jgi:DNA-binding NarL/FixJ family response regulator